MTLDQLIAALRRFYGVLTPPPRDPFMLFVWEVLSAHSTPRQRDAALASLKRARALTPDAMWRAPQKTLEASVALAGAYLEPRLAALRTGVDAFRRSPGLAAIIRGPLRQARRALSRLPQMGDGGMHRMLLFAADQCVMPVDARVRRVVDRLGIVGAPAAAVRPDAAARAARRAITARLPRDTAAYRRAFVYLDHHGAATCTEADPHCLVCPLLTHCPEGVRRVS